MRNVTRNTRASLMLLAATSLVACADGSSGPDSRRVAIAFRASTSGASAELMADPQPAGTPSSASGMVLTSGADVLVVTSADVVIRNLKLQPAGAQCSEGEDASSDASCATVFVGPMLVTLPGGGAEGSRLVVQIPEGSYSAVQLRLHKVSSNKPEERAFRDANPAFDGASVRVQGTWNGTPFSLLTDVTSVVNLPLGAPVLVGGDAAEITIAVDVASWFNASGSGGLINPLLAATSNQLNAQINSNIRAAFRAFRDSNRDGRED